MYIKHPIREPSNNIYLFFNLPVGKCWVPHTLNEHFNHLRYISLECRNTLSNGLYFTNQP
jgi:hypothetical protein